MSDQQSFQRFAAVSAIVCFVTSLASNVLQGIPLNFGTDVFTNPAVMLSIGANGARGV